MSRRSSGGRVEKLALAGRMPWHRVTALSVPRVVEAIMNQGGKTEVNAVQC